VVAVGEFRDSTPWLLGQCFWVAWFCGSVQRMELEQEGLWRRCRAAGGFLPFSVGGLTVPHNGKVL
jgi:hypothetical protein